MKDLLIDISQYVLSHKRMTGLNLKLFFCKEKSEKPEKVLELRNVAAFIDSINCEKINILKIYYTAGSYGIDMAMQLKKPELQKFKEIFLFTDNAMINYTFRALAEEVTWRDFDNRVFGDLSY
jgi:hypothetical protein